MKVLKTILPCLLMAGTAAAEDQSDVHSSVTNSEGTTVSIDKSHRASENWLGKKQYEANEQTVVDPKGLANKQVVSRQYVRKDDGDGDMQEQTKYRHADGTAEKLNAARQTSEHLMDSGKTITNTHSRVVDPKGLGNKQEIEVEQKTDINPDGSKRTVVSRRVNGETVSQTDTDTR